MKKKLSFGSNEGSVEQQNNEKNDMENLSILNRINEREGARCRRRSHELFIICKKVVKNMLHFPCCFQYKPSGEL